MVEDDEVTSRRSAEGADLRAAAGVATALGGVAVAEAETNGRVKRWTVLQGGKPPREALRDDESEPNDDALPDDEARRRLGMASVGWMDCD